ncbi:Alpha/Beta hydrolase protein [Stemphylium lycopersici]|uniref:Alpha/Beta hydrolase protein n=1 Tax=Stemphylium lycopersici TaxID=183478 RepID=A0A364N7E2_STELY|nr:hypothetical protein TW65_02909 [Stemphylium lycopersici]RAR02359.1 Alpha/Beta hydrolase protein [Stemphylium lycopersici]RAR13186.1 Alpha/Beta hydrolase protein [Stemphylium lycopersici]
MTYGYDANVVSFGAMAGQNSLEGNAKMLLEALLAERQDAARPLIFVTHSLGGLLCKQALLMAHNRPEYRSIFDAYAGILFIGTPHKGSKQAKLGTPFVSFINFFRSANTEIVGMLKLRSKQLLMLDDEFWALMDGEKKNCAVHCYSESAPMSSALGFIVDSDSAARPGGRSSPLDGTHSSMLKFETDQDSGYLTLSTKLKGWYNNLPSLTLASPNNAPNHSSSYGKADTQAVGSSAQDDCAIASAAKMDAGAPRPRSNEAASASSNGETRDKKESRGGGFHDCTFSDTCKVIPWMDNHHIVNIN